MARAAVSLALGCLLAFIGAILLSAVQGPDALYFVLGLLCTAGILRQTLPAVMPAGSLRAGRQGIAIPSPRSREHLGFRLRGLIRRRVRFLRSARELGYRDLGGLVFTLHSSNKRNDALVLAKLATLTRIDSELRTLEDVLSEQREMSVLSEAGIVACARCAAVHSSEDNYCPSCGLWTGDHAHLPVAGVSGVASPAQPAPGVESAAAPATDQQAPLAVAAATASASETSESSIPG